MPSPAWTPPGALPATHAAPPPVWAPPTGGGPPPAAPVWSPPTRDPAQDRPVPSQSSVTGGRLTSGFVEAGPATYFWQALVCLFLFLPSGLVAVYFSIMVSKRGMIGDRAGSLRASRLTRLWCFVTLAAFSVLCMIAVVSRLPAG